MSDELKKEETNNGLTAEQPKKKFHAFKYYADVIGWIVRFVGAIVEQVKEKPFPKKDDYTD